NSAVARSSRSALTSLMTRSWSRPMIVAVAKPMPPAPPVITATPRLLVMDFSYQDPRVERAQPASGHPARHVTSGAKTEDDRGAECRAGSRIGSSHHGGGVVAGRVEPFDHRAVLTQRPPVRVGEDTPLGPQVADDEFDRSEWALLQRTEVRVRPHQRVAVVAVVRRVAAAEVPVDASAGEPVEPGD